MRASISLDILIKKLYERNPLAKDIVRKIHELTSKIEGYDKIKIMNFCGTHEWTITHYGIRSLMPESIELVAGPGCPVCITPGYYVDLLIKLSFEGYTILTYGDAYKLPGTSLKRIRSLYDARSKGASVEVVYSFYDAIKKARENKNKKYIFFAVGFETTMPSTAEPLYRREVPENLAILSAYRFTPPIMKYLLDKYGEDIKLHGIIAPGHVSTIIGSRAWEFLPKEYRVPVVVSGFEPIDVLLSIYFILKMLYNKKPGLVNEYRRVVKPEGNLYAQKLIAEVYEVIDAYWRGIGLVEKSGAILNEEYSRYDAHKIFGLKEKEYRDNIPGCRCGEVVLGLIKPTQCPLFLRACTPEKPYGPCMVSVEGTCRIWAENIPLKL